jgi:hypothetical protein
MNLEIPVLRKYTTNSPFKYIIYIHDNNNVLLENTKTGKFKEISRYDIKKYISINTNDSDWVEAFKDIYIKLCNENEIQYFLPLFDEPHRIQTTCFIIPDYLPEYRNGSTYPPARDEDIEFLKMLDQKNDSDFEISILNDGYHSPLMNLDKHGNQLYRIFIKCNLPIFKTYAFILLNDKRSLKDIKFVCEIAGEFYRFPYGNSYMSDSMCLPSSGSISKNSVTIRNIEHFKDTIYYLLTCSTYNADLNRFVRYNSKCSTTLDLDKITKNINNLSENLESTVSFIDVLYYLSKTSVEQINKNVFIRTPNIPSDLQQLLKINQ